MIKLEKILLFIVTLIILMGVVSATENIQEDQTYTDETVANDMSTVSQDNNNEENKVLDENPQKKMNKTKTHSIEKKTRNTNLKQESIIEVHNYRTTISSK